MAESSFTSGYKVNFTEYKYKRYYIYPIVCLYALNCKTTKNNFFTSKLILIENQVLGATIYSITSKSTQLHIQCITLSNECKACNKATCIIS